MKTIIENLDRLSYLSEAQKKSIEVKAQAHLRFSNISFEVKKVDEKELIVQTVQLKHLSENYADAKKLIEVTETVFAPILYGRKLRVGAKPYFEAPADVVTFIWIKEQMAKKEIKAAELEQKLGIDRSTISQYLSGKRELSRGVKSMFYFFFAYEELVDNVAKTDNSDVLMGA